MSSPQRSATFATWEMSPEASLIPTIFGTFLHNLAAVSGKILQPVLDGTLYIMIGSLTDSATIV